MGSGAPGQLEAIATGVGGQLNEDCRWLADYLANFQAFQKGDDWYLANNAAGFWVRRSIDGTEAQVFGIVKKVLKTFEPSVLNTPPF